MQYIHWLEKQVLSFMLNAYNHKLEKRLNFANILVFVISLLFQQKSILSVLETDCIYSVKI